MSIFKSAAATLFLLPTLAALLIPLYSPYAAGQLSIAGLLVYPMAVVNVLGLLYAIWKRSAWKWPYAAACIASAGFVCQNIGTACQADASAPGIRLISWNAQDFQLSTDTLRQAADFINRWNADIICLQERPHDNLLKWDSIRNRFPSQPYTAVNSREDEVLNLAILSRWPLAGQKEYYFDNSYNKILQTDVAYPGQTIRLFNVHLQTTGMTVQKERQNRLAVFQNNAVFRNRQADVLAQAIGESPYPVIVCGDLNDTPASYAYRRIAHGLQDCFKQAGHGWGGSFQPLGGLFRIDYLLCSQAFAALSYDLAGNHWSDHKMQRGIIALTQ